MNRTMRTIYTLTSVNDVVYELVCVDHPFGHYYEIHTTKFINGKLATLVDSGLDATTAFRKWESMERICEIGKRRIPN